VGDRISAVVAGRNEEIPKIIAVGPIRAVEGVPRVDDEFRLHSAFWPQHRIKAVPS
jgi:hypothetical protein